MTPTTADIPANAARPRTTSETRTRRMRRDNDVPVASRLAAEAARTRRRVRPRASRRVSRIVASTSCSSAARARRARAATPGGLPLPTPSHAALRRASRADSVLARRPGQPQPAGRRGDARPAATEAALFPESESRRRVARGEWPPSPADASLLWLAEPPWCFVTFSWVRPWKVTSPSSRAGQPRRGPPQRRRWTRTEPLGDGASKDSAGHRIEILVNDALRGVFSRRRTSGRRASRDPARRDGFFGGVARRRETLVDPARLGRRCENRERRRRKRGDHIRRLGDAFRVISVFSSRTFEAEAGRRRRLTPTDATPEKPWWRRFFPADEDRLAAVGAAWARRRGDGYARLRRRRRRTPSVRCRVSGERRVQV